MNCAEKIKKLVLLAAVVVGIAVYAAFTVPVISELALLFPALIAAGAAGLLTLLLSGAFVCGCRSAKKAFCRAGLLAAAGGAGTVLAALITALIGPGFAVLFRIGTAVSFALLTLLLGGIVAFLADFMNCRCGCDCRRTEVIDDDC